MADSMLDLVELADQLQLPLGALNVFPSQVMDKEEAVLPTVLFVHVTPLPFRWEAKTY